GDEDAYNSIGWMYKFGHGVEQNYSLALEWFHKAAECNNSSGWYNLGCMYRDGHGTAQDLQQALYGFKKAQPTGKWIVDEEIRK
ncbi:tetratricopeptide repeat protein, partial [Salmonella enterica]|uniref:tetratricopeptide repeat protein n=1 Tax=Salmonella enterica TaxID=28901 RepID=UPI000AC92977